jgi:hypothetical protein
MEFFRPVWLISGRVDELEKLALLGHGNLKN